MAHTIERAPTGRAKCRGCGEHIAKDVWRFGERLPNPFADGDAEMTHWYHLPCAAFTRPEPLLETLTGSPESFDDRAVLEHEARLGIAHRRLPRAHAAERASSGRAACRSCKEPIPKGAWRISLLYYEDGRFAPSGFIHVRCAPAYLETTEVIARLKHFSPSLADEDLAEIRSELQEASA